MFKLVLVGILLLPCTVNLFAGDGVCKKCEIIREENKKKINPYVFYEDYLKAEEKKQGEDEGEKTTTTVEQPSSS